MQTYSITTDNIKLTLEAANLEDPNSPWRISTNDIIELSSEEYFIYQKMWSLAVSKFLKPNQNILIIGGGDQQVYKTIQHVASSVTIVDPLAYKYTEDPFKRFLKTSPFVNKIDENLDTHKLTLVDMTFDEALQDECFKTKFDLILVDCSDDFEDIDINIYNKDFVKNVYDNLKTSGSLLMYMGYDHSNADYTPFYTYLAAKLAHIDTYSKYISSYEKDTVIKVFSKIFINDVDKAPVTRSFDREFDNV